MVNKLTVSEFASLGGKARWKNISKKKRSEHAKMMVNSRKSKLKKKVIHRSSLQDN